MPTIKVKIFDAMSGKFLNPPISKPLTEELGHGTNIGLIIEPNLSKEPGQLVTQEEMSNHLDSTQLGVGLKFKYH